MNPDLRALLQLFENKLATMWQIDGRLMETEDDDKAYNLETKQRRVLKEVDDLRNKLTAKIEELTK